MTREYFEARSDGLYLVTVGPLMLDFQRTKVDVTPAVADSILRDADEEWHRNHLPPNPTLMDRIRVGIRNKRAALRRSLHNKLFPDCDDY